MFKTKGVPAETSREARSARGEWVFTTSWPEQYNEVFSPVVPYTTVLHIFNNSGGVVHLGYRLHRFRYSVRVRRTVGRGNLYAPTGGIYGVGPKILQAEKGHLRHKAVQFSRE